MATEFHAHNGAACKATQIWVHNGTAAQKAKQVWIHDGAVARKAFVGSVIANPLNVPDVLSSLVIGGPANVRLQFRPDGFYEGFQQGVNVSTGAWAVPQESWVGSNYWIKATLSQFSSATGGDPFNTWLSLSSMRWWEYAQDFGGSITGIVRFDIADSSSGTNILATQVVRFEAISNE